MHKIYVIGSINCDYSIHVDNCPQKGETIAGHDFCFSQGGKGANQTVALQKMSNQKISFLACVGEDDSGRFLIKEVEKNQVDSSHLLIKKGQQSGACFITVNDTNHDNSIIINKGANDAMDIKDVDDFLKNAQENDILISQLEIPLSIVKYAFKIAKEKKMFVVLNPSPVNGNIIDKSILQYTDLLVPNEGELENIAHHKIVDEKSIKNCYQYIESQGTKALLVTLGEKGSFYIDEKVSIKMPARNVKVVDTTAAGDTFLGAFISQLAIGKSIKDCLLFATIASSITITRSGASQSIPTWQEVQSINNSLN